MMMMRVMVGKMGHDGEDEKEEEDEKLWKDVF